MRVIGLVILLCSTLFQHITAADGAEAVGQSTLSNENVAKPRFSWGLDVGSAIDMTGHDASALDLNACMGYSGPYLRFLGVGASIDMMVSNSSAIYPVYGVLRTDFRRNPQLCFLELRGGVSFNDIDSYERQSNGFGSIGVGVTLAKGRTFSSHIVVSYNYAKLNDVVLGDEVVRLHDLQYALIRIGVTF